MNDGVRPSVTLFRDSSIFALAALYFLGFIAWSIYALTYGLGFLQLSVARYLSAGFLFAVFLAAVLGTDYWFERKFTIEARREWSPGHRTIKIRLLVVAGKALGMVVGLLILSILNATFRLHQLQYLNMGILIGVAIGVGVWEALFHNRRSELNGAWTKSRTTASWPLPGETPRRAPGVLVNWASIQIAWLLLLLALYGTYVQPQVEPEYGGSQPREAWLVMDPRDVSEHLANSLFASNWNQTDGPRNTSEVFVLFEDDNEYLVRVKAESQTDGPLYGIHRSVVRAVIWKS